MRLHVATLHRHVPRAETDPGDPQNHIEPPADCVPQPGGVLVRAN